MVRLLTFSVLVSSVFLSAQVALTAPALGQENAEALPGWRISNICARDSAVGQCRLYEAVARQRIVASWTVIPPQFREACLLKFKPPLEPSWRILADCIDDAARTSDAKRLAAANAASLENARQLEESRKRAAEARADEAAKAAEEEERKRLAAEKAAAEDERKRLAAENAAEEEERKRLAAEKAAEEEERKRLAAEKAAEEEERKRLAAEKAAEEEERKRLADKKAAEEEERKRLADKKAAEDEERKRLAAEKAAEEEERKRLAAAEEQRKRDAERLAAEAAQAAREADEKRKMAEAEAAERAAAEQARLEAEAREAERIAQEKQRLAEAQAQLSAREADCSQRIRAIIDAEPIKFETGRSRVRKFAREQLRKIADVAGTCPTVGFRIDGHTDSLGDDLTNLWLSKQRAKAVVDYLVRYGVDADRVSGTGFGETRPISTNATRLGRRENRRIDFTVVPSLKAD
ncbi:MAG: OmpA family protein [Pseudomonadota bacterium]